MRNQCDPPNFVDAVAIDGAALIHLLPTASITTFDKYANSVFLPHLSKKLEKCVRLEVVWGVYITDSIKASTRESKVKAFRGKKLEKI